MAKPQSLPKSLPGLWRITKCFWPHIRQFRGLIALSFAALAAEVGLRLLEPWPLKFVFDYIIGQRNAPPKAAPGFLALLDPGTLLMSAALAVVVLTCLRAVAAFWETIGFAKLGNYALSRVRAQLYRHLQYLSLSFHTKAKTGDLVVRLISDVGMLQDVAVSALLPLIAKGMIVAGMIGLMFWMHWQLAVIAVAVFPLFWLRTISLSKKLREVSQKQRKQEGAMAASVAETIQAIRTVQALSLEEKFADAFTSSSSKTSLADLKGKRLSAALERSVDVLIALATALVLWFGTRMVLSHQVSAGELLVFLAYLKSAYRPVQEFAKYTTRLSKAAAAGERVIDLLERVPDVRDLPGAVKAPRFEGHVEFRNVSFSYEERGTTEPEALPNGAATANPETPVPDDSGTLLDTSVLLQDITFDVHPGQQVALLGPSGGGKTTLFSLILRLYDPQQGSIRIDGRDIREFTLESLRGQISVVLQDNILFATSIRENIAFGASGATETEIESAARLANAHDFITALPQGYDTVLGERGVTLSHGQRQRIAIARAAIRRAPILILDEPMTGLDSRNEREVLRALEQLYRSRTTFLITHNPVHAATADLILYLERGRVVEHGSHEELLRRNGKYAALHKMRATEPASRSEAGPSLVRL